MNIKEKIHRIWLIAFPIVIQGIVFQIQSLTDKAFLGNLNTRYISALGAAQFPFNTTMDTVVALQTGLVIYIAHLIGAGKREEVKNYVTSSVLFSSILSLGLFILWCFFPEPVLQILRVDSQILTESATYIKICAGTFLVLGIDSALQAMLQGIGNTKPIMVCGMVKVVLNIVISYILIFGMFGIPPMHIVGATIGTLIANVSASVLLFFYCVLSQRKEQCKDEKLLQGISFVKYKNIIAIGLPTAMEYFLWNASNLVLIAFLNSLSYQATAIYTLTFGIEVICYAVFNGIGKATMTLIGQGVGAADYKIADSYLKIGIILNTALVALTGIVFTLLGKRILHIFTKDTALIEQAAFYLIMTAVIMLPKSLNVILGNSIRAYGDTKWMLYSQILGSIFVITCSVILVKGCQLGVLAIYITLFSDECIRAIVNGLYYKMKYAPVTRGALS